MNTQTKSLSRGWEPPFATAKGRKAWKAAKTNRNGIVVKLDGDGATWPIVRKLSKDEATPDLAPGLVIPDFDPRWPGVLSQLVEQTAATGFLTGRSVKQIEHFGLLVEKLHVVGQFGCEWYYDGRRVEWIDRPTGLDEFDRRLPGLLEEVGMNPLASIEWVKSHFRAVHYDESTDKALLNRLLTGLELLANQHGLAYLPGHEVSEMGPRVDKHFALHRFLYEFVGASGRLPNVVIYAGDSAPDLRAFEVLDLFTAMGVHTIKVCTSDNPMLRAQADLIVDGPLGLLMFCQRLCEITA